MSRKVLVTGGRDFFDRELLNAVLDNMHNDVPIDTIINGGARGADSLSTAWARQRGVGIEIYNAEWDKHGKAAGVIRNTKMLDKAQPTDVVAFPGGRGTWDMVNKAINRRLKVGRVLPDTW